MAHSEYNAMLLRIAFARRRPCYCYGCICLTPDERADERRVFKLARAWAQHAKHADRHPDRQAAR